MSKKRKRRDYEDDDYLDTREFFDNLFDFGDVDREFDRMREYMDNIMRRTMRGEINQGEHGPFVYGFSMRLGPDGKPRIEEFGNTKPPKKLESKEGGQFGISEREPLTDVIECDDSISITLEIPGVDKDEIELRVEEDKVSINVDTTSRKYFKEIPLKAKVDPNTSKATYKNGVLDIILKKIKMKSSKGKKVKIN